MINISTISGSGWVQILDLLVPFRQDWVGSQGLGGFNSRPNTGAYFVTTSIDLSEPLLIYCQKSN